MAKDKAQTVTIDGSEFHVSDLSENARNQLLNLRVTDQEIQRLNQQLAIAQTARTAYARALKDELPEQKTH
ncbi:DUF6447 family protein [Vreelandella boliviensis]|uniref:DUF6447 family protein n=1 Tax=Vreelandella boliviensis TaxID=223527 RepID=UPI001B8D892D|nr:DUF6447 family protein [Halomonas boliviensis]MBS3667223.1 hypothetical protein [Halomonas boliviensis]